MRTHGGAQSPYRRVWRGHDGLAGRRGDGGGRARQTELRQEDAVAAPEGVGGGVPGLECLEHLMAGRNPDGTVHQEHASEDRLPNAAAATLLPMEDARR
jgi:hypothetical protein